MTRPENISLPDWEILKNKYPNNLEEIINKINSGYPVQYLIGNVEFYNSIIDIDERVLIPRFETELLVKETIYYIKKIFANKKIDVIDLGTGSGCIAIALKKSLNCNVDALDISIDALDLASNNALNNNVNINFINKDMTDKFTKKYDVIISNPPYIPYDGYVADNVLQYEPNLALFAKDEGIHFYKQIINKHLNFLNKPGLMAFEIGDNQKEILDDYLKKNYSLKYEFKKDFNNRYRYLFIFKE